jgi:NAD(P)H-hydrate repair Nnr-like enzyme with NAD(P)H-hydrate dehydratase domain
MNTYWHKQSIDNPLFPDLEWDKPERRDQAGELLIIGGNLHGFASLAQSYEIANKAGIGDVRILMPDALQKVVGNLLPRAYFAPSTPSGSFSRLALGEWMFHASWADSVLLASDLGRNSETAVVVEAFCRKYEGRLAVTADSVNIVNNFAQYISSRPETLLVMSLGQLQKFISALKLPKTITSSTDLSTIVEYLHEFTSDHGFNLITKQGESLIVASGGEVSTMGSGSSSELWQVKTAAGAVTSWTHHPTKPFQSLTGSVLVA